MTVNEGRGKRVTCWAFSMQWLGVIRTSDPPVPLAILKVRAVLILRYESVIEW